MSGSNSWFNLFGKLFIPRPEIALTPKPFGAKMVGFNRSRNQFVQCSGWVAGLREVLACATCNPTMLTATRKRN
jgi:hypothetical protein